MSLGDTTLPYAIRYNEYDMWSEKFSVSHERLTTMGPDPRRLQTNHDELCEKSVYHR